MYKAGLKDRVTLNKHLSAGVVAGGSYEKKPVGRGLAGAQSRCFELHLLR